MRKISIIFIFLMVCLLPNISFAGVHYVRAGAAGGKTGADWYNAWQTLPTKLVRGDTYYIADGNYPSYTFDDAQSSTTWIRIKKATAADHGTATGWSSTYGDGAAIFTAPLKFITGYYEFDGQTGGGPNAWTTGYGFKVQYTGSANLAKILIIGSSTGLKVSNLVFKHTEFAFTKPTSTATGQDLLYGVYGGSNWTFSYCWLHHPSRTILYTQGVTGMLVEKSRIERNGVNPSSSQHSEAWAARDCNNFIIRYNQILDYRSTGGIIMGRANNWEIYGNVFKWQTSQGSTANNGAIGSWSSSSTYYAKNIKIYNNTFVNLNSGGAGRIFPIYVTISGVTAYNNLWYNSPATYFGKLVTHDYNWFKGSNEGAIYETHKQVGTSDPFVSSSTSNYHLRAATTGGYKLSLPYNLDMDGVTRAVDGVWDRGAYEYK